MKKRNKFVQRHKARNYSKSKITKRSSSANKNFFIKLKIWKEKNSSMKSTESKHRHSWKSKSIRKLSAKPRNKLIITVKFENKNKKKKKKKKLKRKKKHKKSLLRKRRRRKIEKGKKKKTRKGKRKKRR